MDHIKVVTILLGILLFVSLVQAVQLTQLKSELGGSAGSATVSASSTQTSGSNNAPAQKSSSGSLPKNLQNLPAMVGGC